MFDWLPVLRNAKLISTALLLFVGTICVLSVISIQNLNTKYSMHGFLPENHPLYVKNKQIVDRFGLSEEQPILVTLLLRSTAPLGWLAPDQLQKIRTASDVLTQIEGIEHVSSLANYTTAIDTHDGLQVGSLFALTPAETWQQQVQGNFLISPGLLSFDGKVTALIAQIGILSTAQTTKLIASIRERMGSLFQRQDVNVLVSGVIPIEADMTALVGKELKRSLVIGFLICLITLLVYFKSISSVAICIILIVISNIVALAWMAVMGIPFSILSITLPILASITGLAIGSHTLLNFSHNWHVAEHQSDHPAKVQCIINTHRQLVLPNFLMALTTSIGFATLAGSRISLIRDFAWSVTGGILLSWFCVSLALPALMYFFPVPRARRWTSFSARWALWALHFRHILFGAVLLVVAAIVIKGIHLNWSVRLYDDLPKIGSAREAAEVIDRELGGLIPLDVVVEAKENEAWNDPGRIKVLQSLLSHWRDNPVIGSAIGLPDFLKTSALLPEQVSRKSIAETYFLYALSGPGNPLPHFLSVDSFSTRLSLRLRDVPADEMQATVVKVQEEAQRAFPGATVSVGGMATMTHPLNAELSRHLIFGLWQSLFWISVLMIVVFRSFRWALVAAIPNLLGPLAMLAMMTFLHTPIKPPIAIIFSIALGIAYNNTVYLMARLKILKNDVARAWYQEGNPCLFSSIALVGGFAVFLGSYFSLNRVFGAYMLWSIGIGLFGDLILLPILLKMFPRLLSAA